MNNRVTVSIVVLSLVLLLFGCGEEKTDESYNKIKEKGKLVLGLDEEYPPMGFRDESGELVGFDIDLAKEVCKRLNIGLELKPIAWDEKERLLGEGEIDCIWNGMSVDNERRESMLVSDSYLLNELLFVVKDNAKYKSMKDLRGATIGVQSGSTVEGALAKSEIYDNITVVKNSSNTKLLDMMGNGELDAVFIDSIFIYYYISEHSKDYYVLPDVLEKEELAIAFRKGDNALCDKVVGTLHEMRNDGTLEKISTDWFGTDVTIIGTDDINNDEDD